jgi:hypothetical protein
MALTPKQPCKTVPVVFDKEMYDALKLIADADGRGLGILVRRAVNMWLQSDDAKLALQEARNRKFEESPASKFLKMNIALADDEPIVLDDETQAPKRKPRVK